jgi:hypothetical protein
MMTTKMIHSDYKIIFVGKNDHQSKIVPVLYQFCRRVKIHIVRKLQRNDYKTTKLAPIRSAFFPYQKNQ